MIQRLIQNTMKPLHVDTDIEYDLDMTLFPGWDNPITRSQPTLMIHQDEDCGCKNTPTDDLHILIESCVDLECSESDSFIDDILDDSDDSSVYFTTPHSDDSSSSSYTSTTPSSNATEDNLEELLAGIVPICDSVTPDITKSLLHIEEQGPELITLSTTHNERKGVKRRLFSCEVDDDSEYYPAKRQRVQVFNCEDEVIFSVLKDLFNNIQDSV